MMTTHFARYAGILAATVPVMLFSAGTATAAASDVTLSASSTGSTVSVDIVNAFPGDILCNVGGFADPDTPNADFSNDSFRNNDTIRLGAGQSVVTDISRVSPGNYHLYWFCAPEQGASEVWGTAPFTDVFRAPSTAEPFPVTVAAPQACSGSVCLPNLFGN